MPRAKTPEWRTRRPSPAPRPRDPRGGAELPRGEPATPRSPRCAQGSQVQRRGASVERRERARPPARGHQGRTHLAGAPPRRQVSTPAAIRAPQPLAARPRARWLTVPGRCAPPRSLPAKRAPPRSTPPAARRDSAPPTPHTLCAPATFKRPGPVATQKSPLRGPGSSVSFELGDQQCETSQTPSSNTYVPLEF